ALLVRDTAPRTAFLKDFETMPEDMIDYETTERYHADMELCGLPPSQTIRFHDAALLELARQSGRQLVFPAHHVIAFTDRVLHTGRKATTLVNQTWARAEMKL